MAKEPETAAVPFLPLEAMGRLRATLQDDVADPYEGLPDEQYGNDVAAALDMLDSYERARRDVAEQYQALGTLLWEAQQEIARLKGGGCHD